MEKASRVMYSIANFFTWVVVVLTIVLIVFTTLGMTNVIPDLKDLPLANVGGIVYYALVLVFALVTIFLVRIAKNKNSSKGWDILFIVLGVLSWNIFYILGGIFGVIAPRK